MASRFWVGGTGSADGTTTTHWAASSGGAGGATYPGSGDDVIFDALSGAGTVTISASQGWRSLATSGSSLHTYTLNGAVTHSIGSSTSNGTLAADFSGFTSITFGSNTSSVIQFVSTSGTQEQITVGGRTLPSVTFNGAGGSWLLVDGFTTNANSTVTLTAGTLNTGGTTNSWGAFASTGATTRALTLGASALTISSTQSATVWNVAATGLTLTAGTSTITLANTTAVQGTFTGAGLTYNNLTIAAGVSTSSIAKLNGANTFNVVTVGTPKTVIWQSSLIASVTTLTLARGTSLATGVTLNASTSGTQATINITGGLQASDWLTVKDIKVTGNTYYAGPDSSSVSNNSGIVFGNPPWWWVPQQPRQTRLLPAMVRARPVLLPVVPQTVAPTWPPPRVGARRLLVALTRGKRMLAPPPEHRPPARAARAPARLVLVTRGKPRGPVAGQHTPAPRAGRPMAVKIVGWRGKRTGPPLMIPPIVPPPIPGNRWSSIRSKLGAILRGRRADPGWGQAIPPPPPIIGQPVIHLTVSQVPPVIVTVDPLDPVELAVQTIPPIHLKGA